MIFKTRFDIQNITIIENDKNFLRKNIDDNLDNFILKTRQQLNDVRNKIKTISRYN